MSINVLSISPASTTSNAIGQYATNLNKHLREHVKLDECRIDEKNQVRQILFLFWSWIKKDSDIIHVQYEYGIYGHRGILTGLLMLLIFLTSKIQGSKVTLTLHEVILKTDIEPPFKTPKVIYIHLTNFILLYFSDHVIFLSDVAKKRLLDEMSVDSYSTLSHGADISDMIELSKKEAKSELGFSTDDTIIVEPGYVVPRKGSDILIDLADLFGQYTFVLAGGAPDTYQEYYQTIINKKPSNLLVTGILPKREYKLYIIAADIIILPYVHGSQGGIQNNVHQSGVFNQCAAASSLILASDIAYFQQLRNEYRCLLTFDRNDIQDIKSKIYYLLHGDDVNTYLTDNMRDFIDDNSMSTVAKKHVEIFNKIIR
jgi:hypothetical protein